MTSSLTQMRQLRQHMADALVTHDAVTRLASMTGPLDLLDRIDTQLCAGSDEVALTRDDAEVLACLLHDVLSVPREGDRP